MNEHLSNHDTFKIVDSLGWCHQETVAGSKDPMKASVMSHFALPKSGEICLKWDQIIRGHNISVCRTGQRTIMPGQGS